MGTSGTVDQPSAPTPPVRGPTGSMPTWPSVKALTTQQPSQGSDQQPPMAAPEAQPQPNANLVESGPAKDAPEASQDDPAHLSVRDTDAVGDEVSLRIR